MLRRDERLMLPISVFREQHPGLFEAKPEITPTNMLQAVDLALLLKMSGRPEQMQRLLGAVFEFYDQPWATSGSVRALLVPARAEALAIEVVIQITGLPTSHLNLRLRLYYWTKRNWMVNSRMKKRKTFWSTYSFR